MLFIKCIHHARSINTKLKKGITYVQNHRYIFIPIQAAEGLSTMNWRHIQSGYIFIQKHIHLHSDKLLESSTLHNQHEYATTHAQTSARAHRHQHVHTDKPARAHRHQHVCTDTPARAQTQWLAYIQQTSTHRHTHAHIYKIRHYVLLKHHIQWRTYLRMQLKKNKQVTLLSQPCNTILHRTSKYGTRGLFTVLISK
jgi:hypothetical protein